MSDLQNVSGTDSGYQHLGGSSYHIGNRTAVAQSYRYNESDLVTSLGQTTDNIQTGDYVYYDASQDTRSATGTDTGEQQLGSVIYAIYGKTYIEIIEPEANPTELASVTGLYQNRFEGYLELPETSGQFRGDPHTTTAQ